MKKSGVLFFIVVLVFMMQPVQAQAQQGGKISLGNLSLVPGVEVQGIYDDNIFKGNGKDYGPATPTNNQTKEEEKVRDLITHVKPSFMVNYAMQERGGISLGYQGDFAFYDTNRGNNWKNNQGLVDVNYLAPGGLILGVNDVYANSEDPYGNSAQFGIGRITKRQTNDIKTKLGYHLTSNFRTILYYNNSKQRYNDIADFSQDYTENEFGGGMEARFLPKTWGFIRYHYGKRDYDTLGATQTTDEFDSDYTFHRVSAGLAWDPGAKLSGELNVGYQLLRYKNEFADAAKTLVRENKNTWTAATNINFQATETTELTLNISRAVRNAASDNNEQFTDTGIGFNFKQQLLNKLSLLGGVMYSKNEYNSTAPSGELRTDDNYTANLGLKYDIQEWIGVGVGYNYSRKNSNAELNEYNDNQFMASLKIVY